MATSDQDQPRRLDSGDSIETECAAAGIDRAEFDRWWNNTIQQRARINFGRISAGVSTDVSIRRESSASVRARVQARIGSGKELADDVAFDVGEAEVSAGVAVGQAFVFQAKGVQQRGVQVVDVDLVFGGVVAVVVG